jgi:ubiquinone/menaquinone biosynthesis C-methylase UbiE
MSNLSFKFMSFYFRIRDFISSPIKILKEIGISPGLYVLDYGCGSGSYTIPAAQLVGPTGKVYAADIHALAIREVKKKANMRRRSNIHTILTDSNTNLPSASIDVVLLFYVLHDFEDPDIIIKELDRVLKPAGHLSVLDHKLDNDKVVHIIGHAAGGLKLTEGDLSNDKRRGKMLIFVKNNANESKKP